jgi:hypothetical protein
VTVLTDGHRFEGDDVCLAAMDRTGWSWSRTSR